ncbi:hypothetical protein DL766_008942 [Monosporascus sp. MC13-8B]|uniref:NmrA-like domain-containing protein n=1 Tax=Monosporascus cannonballus TaxID=155416 RepID=A0ABY0GW15_9PEZI|nr:hypothetical protein DL762_008824 [Monosporascus cannonballus]RYO94397.1 hypothetical protein DL763_004113 [Monosporascus cannonballus]RYP17279.1 hypothetical protein DL766_008942 [Monosporascus sp. MC13-8B]
MTTQQQQHQPILIVGAGELGTAVLEALVAHPKRDAAHSPISVLLRKSTIESADPAKRASNERLRALGAAELVPGDVVGASEEELADTFRRFHTVVVCAGMGLPAGTQLRIARAALAAGVPRLLPWQWGVDYDAVGPGSAQDLFDEQLAVRRLLRGQEATDWVVVSVGLFMSFLFEPAFGAVDPAARTARGLGGWDTPVTATAVRDVGRVAAEAVCDPRDAHRRVVYAGGDTLTYGRVAELAEKRFGGHWTREEWPLDLLKRKALENPDDAMVKYQIVFGAGRGVAWDLAGTINRQRGMQMQTVEDYLAEMQDLE